jgi:hypothetical protein
MENEEWCVLRITRSQAGYLRVALMAVMTGDKTIRRTTLGSHGVAALNPVVTILADAERSWRAADEKARGHAER